MVYCAVIPPKSLKAAWYSIPSHENDQLPSSQEEEEVKNKNIRAIMKGELTSFFFSDLLLSTSPQTTGFPFL